MTAWYYKLDDWVTLYYELVGLKYHVNIVVFAFIFFEVFSGYSIASHKKDNTFLLRDASLWRLLETTLPYFA